MSFFDRIPTGRLLNCFARDLDELDQILPMVVKGFLLLFLSVVFNLLVVSVISPYILLIGVVLAVICFIYYV